MSELTSLKKLPSLRVRSVEPAVIHDNQGTIARVLEQQRQLLDRQQEYDHYRVDPKLLGSQVDGKAQLSKLRCRVGVSAGRLQKIRAKDEHHMSLTGNATAASHTSAEGDAIYRQFPFAPKMHPAQADQCAQEVNLFQRRQEESSPGTELDKSLEQAESATDQTEKTRQHVWRERNLWRILQMSENVKKLALEGEALRYIVFFTMVLLVTHFLTHVQHEYEASNAIKEALTDDFYEGIETFGTVANYENFWAWAKQGLLPAVFTDTKLIGGSNLIFGAVRFRQIRVDSNSCSISAAGFGISSAISPCYASSVDGNTKQTTSFGPNGRYVWSSSGLSTIRSRYKVFGDDGYFTDIPLTSTLAEATAAVQQLIDDDWLASPTRVVVVELTTVNVNVGLFTYVQAISEFNAGGNVYNIVRTFGLPIESWTELSGFYPAFSVLTLMFVSFTYGLLRRLFNNGFNELRSFWSIFEVFDKGIYFGFFAYVWILYVAHRDMSINVNSSSFAQGLWDPCHERQTMIDILSCTVIITFFRLFKYFRLEPRMGVLLDSVTQASRDIFWFLIAWLCTTGGFAGCAFLLFGHSNLDFHRMDSAMFMLVRMMLGELDAISELVDSQFYVANIYFILFAIVVTIILLNLLIGIVSEYFAIEHARHQLMEEESRRRGYLLPQFEYPLFAMTFMSWWAILSDTEVNLWSRMRATILAMCGFSPAWGDQTASCYRCRNFSPEVMTEKTQKTYQLNRSTNAAFKLSYRLGMNLTEVIWSYLELSLSQELSEQATFLKENLDFFKIRTENSIASEDTQQSQDSDTQQAHDFSTYLPHFLTIPEMAYILQYHLMHPDLRPGASLESDQRFQNMQVLGCNIMKSFVSKEEQAANQFGQHYVQLAMLLADIADCQADLDCMNKMQQKDASNLKIEDHKANEDDNGIRGLALVEMCNLKVDDSWLSLKSDGIWQGTNAVDAKGMCESPQWLLHVRETVQLYVKVAQAQPGTGQEFLPIWLALYRMQDGQQKQVSRIRLFKAKGLRVAAGEGFSADKETVLHIQELQATISDQAPYVLVVGAMAQGQQRSFDIVVSAKPLVRQLGNADGKALIEMVRWVPETIPIKEDPHVDAVHEHFENKKHCNS